MKAEKSVERSVDSLQKIYAVVVSLAIGEAIKRFFLKDGKDFLFSYEHLPEFVAFVFTILPFAHGMNRHLDSVLTMVRESGKRGSLIYLLIDFAFFIVESCFFFSLAATINTGLQFFRILQWLLLFDMLWAAITHRVNRSISLRWIKINLAVWTVILVVIWRSGQPPHRVEILLLATAAILRTAMDYKFGWDFYFPPDDPAPAPAVNLGEQPEGVSAERKATVFRVKARRPV